MQRNPGREGGFSLIELLVVVIIIGIIAAIAIPRFLSQREQANNAAAISDLRNLIAVETSLEAASGLTTDRTLIAQEGWEASVDRIVVCARLIGSADITLKAWHLDGSTQYSYQRSTSVIDATQVPLTASCSDQGFSDHVQIVPEP